MSLRVVMALTAGLLVCNAALPVYAAEVQTSYPMVRKELIAPTNEQGERVGQAQDCVSVKGGRRTVVKTLVPGGPQKWELVLVKYGASGQKADSDFYKECADGTYYSTSRRELEKTEAEFQAWEKRMDEIRKYGSRCRGCEDDD